MYNLLGDNKGIISGGKFFIWYITTFLTFFPALNKKDQW